MTERYLDGMRETDTHLLMSCSKSLTSILCGVLAGRGLLAPGDLVTDHLPELAGSAWEGCRLQDILDMRAGNAWDYDVDEYTILDVSDYRTHDLHGDDPARHRDLDPHDRPRPARPRQRAVPLLLARHRRARLGARAGRRRALPRALLARGVVADRRRAGRRRSCSTTPASPSSEGGICTTLRDLARFGLMCLDDGTALGQQVVPADWIARVRVRDAELIDAFRASDGRRSRPARRLLPRQVVDRRRPARRLRGARDERPVDPHPPPGAHRDREVLDLPGRARRRPLRARTTRA